MNVNWFNLAVDGVLIYAVVEAVAAARRVSDKRQRPRAAQVAAYQSVSFQEPSSRTVSSPSTVSSQLPSFQTQPAPSESLPDSNQSDLFEEAASSAATESIADPIASLMTDLDLPLAVSLAVSDVTYEAEAPLVTSSLELDLVPPELAIPELEAVADTHHSAEHHSVLAEIVELGQADADNAMVQLRRYLDHPDDIIRAATVFELGELAAKQQGPGATEIIDLLLQLGQDANPLVREQALLAWAKVQPIIPEA